MGKNNKKKQAKQAEVEVEATQTTVSEQTPEVSEPVQPEII
jgi:hypothetical protein